MKKHTHSDADPTRRCTYASYICMGTARLQHTGCGHHTPLKCSPSHVATCSELIYDCGLQHEAMYPKATCASSQTPSMRLKGFQSFAVDLAEADDSRCSQFVELRCHAWVLHGLLGI